MTRLKTFGDIAEDCANKGTPMLLLPGYVFIGWWQLAGAPFAIIAWELRVLWWRLGGRLVR